MNYGEIKKNDIANGVGVRVSLFVSGCRHHCKNCFNAATWSFDFGKEFGKSAEDEIINAMKPDHICGFSLLGGEPFEPENQRELLPFLQRLKKMYPDKTVWCYSGFTYEELIGDSRASCECTIPMLECIDVLVDGRFVEELKDISLEFRGSSNQRIIDVKKSLNAQKPVIWKRDK